MNLRARKNICSPMNTEAELREAITRQKGNAGIIIPAHYTDDLLQGKKVSIELVELRVSESFTHCGLQWKGWLADFISRPRL